MQKSGANRRIKAQDAVLSGTKADRSQKVNRETAKKGKAEWRKPLCRGDKSE